MTSVFSCYVEQIQTTLETMRRRGLVAYDATSRGATYLKSAYKELPKQLKNAQKSELTKEIHRDVVSMKPLDPTNKSRRNTLQEMYFGLAVLAVAICAGQTTGVLFSASILSSVFDKSVECLMLVLLPIYAYLHLNERKVYDAIEHRSWMFGLVFVVCVLIGDLAGASILTANPSFFFVPPLLFALMLDVEFSPNSFYANRQLLFGGLVAGSFLITQTLAVIFGMMTFAGVLVGLLNAVFLVVHFQVMESRIEDERFGRNESQLVYVASVLLMQLPLALLFGFI